MGIYQNWKVRSKSKRAIAFYRSFLKPDQLCFDIGAHRGEVSRWLLTAGARVVAVEPLSDCQPDLGKLYAEFRDRFVHLNSVVSNKTGNISFYPSSQPEVSTCSTEFIDRYSRYPDLKWGNPVEVGAISLDELVELHGMPVFIKLDTEGFESIILEGLSQPVNRIQFEWNYHLREVAISALEELKRLGEYKFNWWRGESFKWEEKRLLDADQMQNRIEKMPPEALTGEVFGVLHA